MLCEKALTLTVDDAEEMVALPPGATGSSLEAMWTAATW